MEHQLWSEVQGLIRRLARPKRGRCDYSDGDIARTYYWAVLHDRPTAWACDPGLRMQLRQRTYVA